MQPLKINPLASPKAVAACLVLVAALYLSTVAPQLGDWSGDAAHYILLAESIARGSGYIDPVEPGSMIHNKYPPLFPLILSPVSALFGRDMLAMRVWVAVIALFAAAFWLFYYREILSRGEALALTALFALHPYSFNFVTRTLSETPFLLFTGAAFLFYARWKRRAKGVDLALMLLASVLAFMTRTAGVALLAAMAAAVALDRGLRARRTGPVPALIPAVVVMGIAFVAWTGFVLANSGPAFNYFRELSSPLHGGETIAAADLVQRLGLNLGYYSLEAPAALLDFVPSGSIFRYIAAAVVWPLVFWGAFRMARKGSLLEPLYFGFTLVMVLLWPAHLDFRFLYPLMPILILFGYKGLQALAGLTKTRAAAAAAPAAFALLLAAFLVKVALIAAAQHRPDPFPPQTPVEMLGHLVREPVIDWSRTCYAYSTPENIFAFGEFLVLHRIAEKNLPPGSIMASDEPRDTAFILGWPAVANPATQDADQAIEYLESWEVDYLVVDRYSPHTGRFVFPLLRSRPDRFTMVVGDPGKPVPAVYRFERASRDEGSRR